MKPQFFWCGQWLKWSLIGVLGATACVSSPHRATTPPPLETRRTPPIKTLLPTARFGPEFTEIETPNANATWTPLPTLSPTEAVSRIQDLLTHNASCRLPCWWGIEPGSSWDATMRQRLATFTDIQQGDWGYRHENGIAYELTYYSISYNLPQGRGRIMVLERKHKFIDLIEVVGIGTDDTYQLPQVLSVYGAPDAVWLLTGNTAAGFPFHVILDYSGQGFLASYKYEGRWEDVQGIYRACPDGTGPELWLWSPTTPWTLAEIAPLDVHTPKLQPLEQTTGMSIEIFYQTFQDLNSGKCLETPVSLWP